MEKAIFNKRGTKQIINSGWKEFDKQVTFISEGNVISNVQHSGYIHPFCERVCNGREYAEGHLMNFDLSCFSNIPNNLMEIIRDVNRRDSVILYEFYVYNKKTESHNTFAWALTDRNHCLIDKRVITYYGESYWKRQSALNEILKYITA